MIAESVIPDSCHQRVTGTGGQPAAKVEPWKLGDRLYHTFLWGEVPENYGPSLSDDYVARQAAEFIARPPSEPYFLLVNQTFPHPPYAVHEPYYSMYDRAQVPFPIRPPADFRGKPAIIKRVHERMRMNEVTDDELREIVAVFYGMITKTDRNLGWIMDALKETGQWDNTILVASSDHGDFAGDYASTEKMQNTFEDCLTRVPFVVKPPRGVAADPGIREALIELVDFPATVFDLAGVEPGYTHFGPSLLPLLADRQAAGRDAVFCEGGRLRGETQAMELESRQSPDGLYWPRLTLQADDSHPYHTKAVMCRTREFKYVRRLYEPDELYDLRRDPDELRNVADDPAYGEAVSRLRDRLLTWYQETCDVVPRETDQR